MATTISATSAPPPSMATTATEEQKMTLHLILLPLMSPGHTLPFLHAAEVIALRHPTTHVTLVTTNESPLRRPFPTHLPNAHLLTLPSPSSHSTADAAASESKFPKFFLTLPSLRRHLEPHLRSLQLHDRHNLCIISDFAHMWSRSLAADLHVPFLLFHSISCFSLLCLHLLREAAPGGDPNLPITVPGLPDRVVVTRTQVPGFFSMPGMEDLKEEFYQGERLCDGVVVNSFEGLESWYVTEYQKMLGKKLCTIGPVDLLAKRAAGDSGEKVEEEYWWKWLDKWGVGEVVYLGFGSVVKCGMERLLEVGLGLEGCGYPFLWVARGKEEQKEEVNTWLGDFQGRVGERGLVINGWAPQVRILNHPAVGAFVTHGGWNSTLESLSAGVPMVTWPHFAEQFLNAKMVVDVLKVGVGVKVAEPFRFGKNDKAFVSTEAIVTAIKKVMDKGEEGEARRKRVREIASTAKEAIGEGGTSDANLMDLIVHVNNMVNSKEEK